MAARIKSVYHKYYKCESINMAPTDINFTDWNMRWFFAAKKPGHQKIEHNSRATVVWFGFDEAVIAERMGDILMVALVWTPAY